MSQFDFGDLESPLSGSAFINSNLEPWRDALHSSHKGNSRPSYAVAGMLWINDTTNPWVVNIFDGSDDIVLGTINTTTNTFSPAVSLDADDIAFDNTASGLAASTAQDAIDELASEKLDASGAWNAIKVAATDTATGVVEKATATEVVNGTADKYPDASLLKHHQGSAKAWANFNGQGTIAIRDSYNVSSISDLGVGIYTVNFTSSMANANYAPVGICTDESGAGTSSIAISGLTTSGCSITADRTNDGTRVDPSIVSVVVFGDI